MQNTYRNTFKRIWNLNIRLGINTNSSPKKLNTLKHTKTYQTLKRREQDLSGEGEAEGETGLRDNIPGGACCWDIAELLSG
jgi:hypothetical protein